MILARCVSTVPEANASPTAIPRDELDAGRFGMRWH